MNRILGLVLLIWTIWLSQAFARPEVHIMGYVPGDLTAQEASERLQNDIVPFHIGQSLGFSQHPVWFLITVKAEQTEQPRYLVIEPINLDHLSIHDADDPDRVLFEGGDAGPSPISLIKYGYTLQLPQTDLNDHLLVRIDTRNLLQPSFEVLTLEDLMRLEHLTWLSFSIALAATLFYLLWAGSTMLMYPSWLLGSFVLRLVLYVVTLFIHSGAFRVLAGDHSAFSQDLSHNITGLTYVTAAQVFDYLLFRELRSKWPARVFLGFILAFSIAKFIAFALGDTSLALRLNNSSVMCTLIVTMSAFFAAPNVSAGPLNLSRNSVGTYFLLQAVIIGLLMYLGVTQSGRFNTMLEIAFLMHSVLPGAYVTWLLFQRQRRILRQQRQLQAQHTKLQIHAAAESQKRTEISDLLRMLTHEVKTPLATLQMAQSVGELDAARIEGSVSTIRHLLQQCDRVDDIENGELIARIEPLNLCAALQRAARDSEIELTPQTQQEQATVLADVNLLEIVLNNLCSNAKKYRKTGTRITCRIMTNGPQSELHISNRLRDDMRPDPAQMFDKYYRHQAAHRKPGTGLGLYIVRQLCTRMGITVFAKLENNALTVVLRMPTATQTDVGKCNL